LVFRLQFDRQRLEREIGCELCAKDFCLAPPEPPPRLARFSKEPKV
jgi:hypothetical protein